MSRVRFESKIPSCHVTKDLIKALEIYLFSRVSALCRSKEERDALKKCLTIEIADSFGTETLSTIDEYLSPKFSDDITELSVELTGTYRYDIPHVDVDIQFNRQPIHSKVRITFEGENAREFVAGLGRGISDVIKTQATSNWIFHPPSGMEGAFWGLAPLSPLFVVASFNNSPALGVLSFVIVLLFLSYAFLAKRLRPYISFDSNAAQNLDRRWRWFVGGLMSFILFSTLLPQVRDAIFLFINGAR